MPVWADPRRGERVRLLADDDMTLLATFVAPPGPRPLAADLRAIPGADLDRLASVAVRDLPGVRVVTRRDEAEALTRAGAAVVSVGAHMVRDLDAHPPPVHWAAPNLPAGLRLGPIDRPVQEYAAAQREGFSPGHVDRGSTIEAQQDGSLDALLAGERMGPLYEDASALVTDGSGRIVAGLVVVLWPGIGDEWHGGPWAVDLFRLRSLRTTWPVGRHLLARAVTVAALDGHRAMGLSVNAANPARRLYGRLGFADRFYRFSLDLPGRWPATSAPRPPRGAGTG